MKCGTNNETDIAFCGECNSPLPRIADSVSPNTATIKGRFESIQSEVQRHRAGDTTVIEFAEFVQSVYDRLVAHRDEILAYVKETSYDADEGEEVQAGKNGMALFEEGLEMLYRYTEEGNTQDLDDGLSLIWDGNELINQAVRQNRVARKKLEDQWGYL